MCFFFHLTFVFVFGDINCCNIIFFSEVFFRFIGVEFVRFLRGDGEPTFEEVSLDVDGLSFITFVEEIAEHS